MVLGLRMKNRKGTSVQVDYIIHVQEIKPWPPSQSLRSLRSVLLQWENGEKNSGSLSPVTPSVGTGVGDGKIEFNESFRLTVSLLREASAKGGNADVFQKNCLELNLYEPRRDKTVKGQLLGNVVVDLAEYGIIKESISFSILMNCKRSFRNTAQPLVFIKIQPLDKDSSSSSPMESLSKEASLDKDGRESVSALMNEEYAEEAEIASFTDDDVSSHSSLTISSSTLDASADLSSQNGTVGVGQLQEENTSAAVKESKGKDNEVPELPSDPGVIKSVGPVSAVNPSNVTVPHRNEHSSRSSSIDLSSGPVSPEIGNASASNFPERSLTLNLRKSADHSVQSSSSSIAYEVTEEEVRFNNSTRSLDGHNLLKEVLEKVVDSGSKIKENNRNPVKEKNITNGIDDSVESSGTGLQMEEKTSLVNMARSEVREGREGESRRWSINRSEEASDANGIHQTVVEKKDENKHVENGQTENVEIYRSHLMENEHIKNHPRDSSSNASVAKMEQTPVNLQNRVSADAVRKPVTSAGDQLTFSRRGLAVKGSSFTTDRLNHAKLSVSLPLDTAGGGPLVADSQSVEEVKEIDILEDLHNGSRSFITNMGKDVRGSRSSGADRVKRLSRDAKSSFSDSKVQQLEHRMETLEAELREAAAVELGLYSIVAEHGSSAHKVHAPARRLSRLYIHASKQWSRQRRASAARSSVSGLVLVAKACGNDVPRLTFWLSNSVVLRAIITEAVGDAHLVSAGSHIEINGVGKRTERKSSPLKWKESPLNKKEKQLSFSLNLSDWEEPHTFTAALEKIEAWIFSRIIESVWWQTLTPHMQSSAEASERKMGSNSKKSYERKPSLSDQQQGNFSINLWKKAFKDACERICPVRAGGHECGCLPILARLVSGFAVSW